MNIKLDNMNLLGDGVKGEPPEWPEPIKSSGSIETIPEVTESDKFDNLLD